mgnify:FL=1
MNNLMQTTDAVLAAYRRGETNYKGIPLPYPQTSGTATQQSAYLEQTAQMVAKEVLNGAIRPTEDDVKYPIKKTFTTKMNLSLENSYMVLDRADDVECEVTVGIKSDDYGYFEMYDLPSDGLRFYAEGGIWFTGKEVVDYDGVFSLPQPIIDQLKRMGYDTTAVE